MDDAPNERPRRKKKLSLSSHRVEKGADAARLFRVHPAIVVRVLARHRVTQIRLTAEQKS
ncbi:hypothetical protein [Candidatus Williamhamiltonella defendens]|uniref:hypothetical protein n=1 Tax=Candidatus Williamhamiltonella defendens TaxID=138072 RepID=UPI001F21D2C8|nr:hypothetical protein [Candidatus Hamiltonella defensa]